MLPHGGQRFYTVLLIERRVFTVSYSTSLLFFNKLGHHFVSFLDTHGLKVAYDFCPGFIEIFRFSHNDADQGVLNDSSASATLTDRNCHL